MEKTAMIAQVNKDIAKLVKNWAISLGFKPSKVGVRAGSGKSGYICLTIKSEPYTDHREPIRYEKTLPPDVCRRMLLVVYPNADWVKNEPNKCYAGNIFNHMATMTVHEWANFLNAEGFTSN